ncbi:hypothetical protein Q1W71_14005 [Flavobacterium pectinovorum]|nr:hypothetical protein [Flavobacterium pectinovorum]WKL50540.1 hypothetical protein Q1W71_14005 [Flavobacterium pectinovorum]
MLNFSNYSQEVKKH